jgi:DNA ligase-1
MKTINERIEMFSELFEDLQNTSSHITKESIINELLNNDLSLEQDWKWILEVLANKYPLGYKISTLKDQGHLAASRLAKYQTGILQNGSLEDYFESLWLPMRGSDLSINNILYYLEDFTEHELDFIQPIVDRELRIGYSGKEDMKDTYTPMLAKKWQDEKHKLINKNIAIYIQEKYDGNRCIAYHKYFDTQIKEDSRGTWCFKSRSGKDLKVNFNMWKFLQQSLYDINANLPEFTDLIFDGEIIHRNQLHLPQHNGKVEKSHTNNQEFNKTNGAINSKKAEDKEDLIYVIYDIIDIQLSYKERYKILESFNDTKDIIIAPTLFHTNNYQKFDNIDNILETIVSRGGEGIILRLGNGVYEHKRSSNLLKYKKVQTMDMKCIGYENGTGKYADMIGSLQCRLTRNNGDKINVWVGSGLSDEDRQRPVDYFLNKILEIDYFEITKPENSDIYSLRFPRFVKVREDKNETSEY